MPFLHLEIRGSKGGVEMLTPQQEIYCINRALKKMTQREAYREAYPKAKCKDKGIDERASRLEAQSKISARITELMTEEKEHIQEEAKWTRQNAYNDLQWLITKAKEEIETRGEMSGPNVSALINAVKELNTIFAVGEKSEGGGVLDDILNAVRGINND